MQNHSLQALNARTCRASRSCIRTAASAARRLMFQLSGFVRDIARENLAGVGKQELILTSRSNMQTKLRRTEMFRKRFSVRLTFRLGLIGVITRAVDGDTARRRRTKQLFLNCVFYHLNSDRISPQMPDHCLKASHGWLLARFCPVT